MNSKSFDKYEEKVNIKAKDEILKSNDYLNLSSINKSSLKLIINGLSILYLLYGRFLYIKSLKGCPKSEFVCLNEPKLIKDDINNCLNSIVYFIFVLFLIHMNICSFYILIILILIYIELTIRDHGENFLNHGKLNLFALFSLTIIGEIVFLFIILYKYLLKKKIIYFICDIIIFFNRIYNYLK
jgi:hypothetical protein